MQRSVSLSTGLLIVLSMVACKKDDDKNGRSFGAPLIKPPVEEATPAGLKVGSTALTAGVAVETLSKTPQERLKTALTQEQGAINGGKCNGIIGCSLQALDFRIAEINSRSAESEKKCQNEAPVDFTFNPLDSSITLQVQCNDIFATDTMNQGESGLIFGKKDTVFSMGMTLNQTEGRFAYAATYDESSGEVNYLEANYWEGDASSRVSLTKLKANRTAKSFELFYTNTADTYGIGCGAHMVSNGTQIFISGKFQEQGANDCATAPAREVCLNADTLEVVSSGCALSASNFTLTATPYATAEGGMADLKSKLGASHYTNVGTAFVVDAP